jgi:hypothetical protein
MIIKINQNKLDRVSQTELQNIKLVLIQLEGLTLKTEGGIVEIFKEKELHNDLSFEDLYRKIGNYQLDKDIVSQFSNGYEDFTKNRVEEEQTKETDMYISSVNRSYVS